VLELLSIGYIALFCDVLSKLLVGLWWLFAFLITANPCLFALDLKFHLMKIERKLCQNFFDTIWNFISTELDLDI